MLPNQLNLAPLNLFNSAININIFIHLPMQQILESLLCLFHTRIRFRTGGMAAKKSNKILAPTHVCTREREKLNNKNTCEISGNSKLSEGKIKRIEAAWQT